MILLLRTVKSGDKGYITLRRYFRLRLSFSKRKRMLALRYRKRLDTIFSNLGPTPQHKPDSYGIASATMWSVMPLFLVRFKRIYS